MSLTGCGGLARVPNLRVCKHRRGVAHAGSEGLINILPWYRPVGVAETSSETQRRKSRAARKGKWPPRGTGTTFLTHPGSAPRRTGKAGENGQHSGEVGGSSAWTRPSAPECGDTLKSSSGRPASDLGWGSSSKTAPGSLSTGSPAGRTHPHGDGSMYSQANVRVENALRPPTRALLSVIVDTEKVLREADGPTEARGPEANNAWWVERCSPRGAPQNRMVRAGRSPKNTCGWIITTKRMDSGKLENWTCIGSHDQLPVR